MRAWALVCCALGCAAPAPTPPSEPPPAAASSAPAPAPLPLKTLPEAHTDFPVSVRLDDNAVFERVLETPVRAIAVDKGPHVSALAERAVHIHDQKGWREEALPPPALGDAQLALFYGRDYRVRLVGTRQGDAGLETLYYRWLPGGFRAAPDEIGRLGTTRKGGFVALLGTADPEVVCRPGDVCLVKRLSGWATIAAPADIELVAIHGGGAWAVAGRSLLTVDNDKRWKAVSEAGPWSKASALCVAEGSIWVASTIENQVHRFDGAIWTSSASPSSRPRVLWSGGGKETWLGGQDGLFRHDGSEWRKMSAVTGAVSAIAGRSAREVWAGGSAGLFQASP